MSKLNIGLVAYRLRSSRRGRGGARGSAAADRAAELPRGSRVVLDLAKTMTHVLGCRLRPCAGVRRASARAPLVRSASRPPRRIADALIARNRDRAGRPGRGGRAPRGEPGTDDRRRRRMGTPAHRDVASPQARAALGDLPTARSASWSAIVASGADFGYTLGWATAELTNVLRIVGRSDRRRGAGQRDARDRASASRCPVMVGRRQGAARPARRSRAASPDTAEKLLHQALARLPRVRRHERYLPQTLRRCWPRSPRRLDSGEEAARILGAAHRVTRRARPGPVARTTSSASIAELERALREQLGEAAFDAAYEAGTAALAEPRP